jgi:uncharacterized protein YbbK (DUF523 family)
MLHNEEEAQRGVTIMMCKDKASGIRLVSACLAGFCCRYDERDNENQDIVALVKEGKAVPICPEQLGGLPTPRCPAEIIGGDGFDVITGNARVITKDGTDVTEAFIKGAREAWKLCRRYNIQEALLKSRSPSCGVYNIYDGTFSERLREGMGVTAAFLHKNGVRVSDR